MAAGRRDRGEEEGAEEEKKQSRMVFRELIALFLNFN